MIREDVHSFGLVVLDFTTDQKAIQPTYVSTPTCLHPRQQAPLSLDRKQHVSRRSQTQKSPPPASPPPNITYPHQHYQTAYGPRYNWHP
jgi:hypothetical protein